MSRQILSASLCLLALTGCQSMSGVATSFAQVDRYDYPAVAPAGAIAPPGDQAASPQAPGLPSSPLGKAAIASAGMQVEAPADGLDAGSSELATRIAGRTELYTKDFDIGMSSVEARGLVRDFFGDMPYRKYQPRPALPIINIDEMRTAMADSQAEPSVHLPQPVAGDPIAPATPAPTALARAPSLPATPTAPAPATSAVSAVVPAPLPPVARSITG